VLEPILLTKPPRALEYFVTMLGIMVEENTLLEEAMLIFFGRLSKGSQQE
jgi:hypothetical protein